MLIETIPRKTLIDFYLNSERIKKNKLIPPVNDSLIWNDPNKLDNWLEKYCYKSGVISGFKQWAYVQISKEDLLNSAIVNSIDIFNGKDQLLGSLKNTKEFYEWKPNKNPFPIWYKPLSDGKFRKEFSIIIRPACNGERKQGAKFYIEDGSGRGICYLRSILKLHKESEMVGFFGFDPDRKSRFLQNELGREFSEKNYNKYSTFEESIKTLGLAENNKY